jgi:sarcosine oxidase
MVLSMHADEKQADVIVLGLGAWGSSIAYHAARTGFSVLGFDQFDVPHPHGSSHGKTRGFRLAGPESDDYVALNVRAGELFDQLSAEHGAPTLVRPGAAYVGSDEFFYLAPLRESLERHDFPFEILDQAEAAKRFPKLAVRKDEVLLFDPAGGVIFPEETIEAHLNGARQAGADLHMSEEITSWDADGDEVTVETPAGTYSAQHLVVAAGPWAPNWFGDDLPIEVERQVVAWFGTEGTPFADSAAEPFWAFQHEGYQAFYGFPDMHGDGVKVALHHGGATGRYDQLDHQASEEDLDRLRDAVTARVPSLAGAPVRKSAACYYTNSPDLLHFVGTHPDHERVIVATGDSGRGFKLAPVVGEMVADLLKGEKSDTQDVMSLTRKVGSAA